MMYEFGDGETVVFADRALGGVVGAQEQIVFRLHLLIEYDRWAVYYFDPLLYLGGNTLAQPTYGLYSELSRIGRDKIPWGWLDAIQNTPVEP